MSPLLQSVHSTNAAAIVVNFNVRSDYLAETERHIGGLYAVPTAITLVGFVADLSSSGNYQRGYRNN